MHEWLTVIIVLLIIGVVLDGFRRARNARYSKLHMSKSVGQSSERAALHDYGSELPNGGARIKTREDEEHEILNSSLRQTVNQGAVTESFKKRIPEQVSLNLDESVPMLMDVEAEQAAASIKSESESGAESELEESSTAQAQDADAFATGELDLPSSDEVLGLSAEFQDKKEPSMSTLDDLDDDALDNYDGHQSSRRSQSTSHTQSRRSEPKLAEVEAAPEPEEVLIINVMAKHSTRFMGDELLTVLLENGMRFGEMDIFHRHESEDGSGSIMFSMANMVKPGNFNLNTMSEFQTPGVSLFMTLPMRAESIRAFTLMETTAKDLAARLGGELKDENRSVMTGQTLEHCRQRIREFERKQLTQASL